MPEIPYTDFERRRLTATGQARVAVRVCVPADFAGYPGDGDDRLWCRYPDTEVRRLLDGGWLDPSPGNVWRGIDASYDQKSRPLVILHDVREVDRE